VPRDDFFDDLAIEDAGQAHQDFRGTSGTLTRAVADTIAILAEISRREGYMERHGGHRFTWYSF